MTKLQVIILGASGAVGSAAVATLQDMDEVSQITALVRRPLAVNSGSKLQQHIVDVMNPASYVQYLHGHEAAICTFGVGQPSKVSQADFKAVDFDAVLAFTKSCKEQGVQHFELLGSVAADPKSQSSYLKSKGDLREAIAGLGFARFSCFQPSLLLTQNNRYGFAQGLLLSAWPALSHLLLGGLQKYRGIRVEDLGAAMAHNLRGDGRGVEALHWPQFQSLISTADIS
jgi:uncharacterized protein YbjT (DUF2867 family)